NIRAVAVMPIEFIGSQEALADKTSLHAKHAIQLDGMPARFVDLEGDLGPIQNDRRDAARALWSGKQLDRLFANSGTVVGQIHCLDKLVAGCSSLTSKRVGIGTGLYLTTGGIYGA